MLSELRMLIADTLLGWALAIVPANHPDADRLVRALKEYLEGPVPRRTK